jgi:FkbM family methyltransferase
VLTSMRSTLSRSNLARQAYSRVRAFRDRREAMSLFVNSGDYLQALRRKSNGEVTLQTQDGLQIAIRQNLWDAEIVREVFFEQPYTRHLDLPREPVVADVGGYIGDFTLYAMKYLGARRVVVYEPTEENFSLLHRNIALNGFEGRVTAVPSAVGPSGEIVLNVESRDAGETHASSHLYADAERRRIASVSLAELLDAHELDTVDLLKVDCEGGEYEIFPQTPDRVFDRIRNIAFEWHEVPGYAPLLDAVRAKLESVGYRLRRDGYVISCCRS